MPHILYYYAHFVIAYINKYRMARESLKTSCYDIIIINKHPYISIIRLFTPNSSDDLDSLAAVICLSFITQQIPLFTF